jgi:hypothetical protein
LWSDLMVLLSSVGFAYKTIWVESSDFFEQFLERGGETAISITPWEKMPVTYTAITKPDRFHGTRQVSYVHNKKYMVGPSSIPTMQTQRYAWDANTRLVITITTLVSDAPYCDYFRAETRWVFSNTAKEGVCQLQVGISIQWVKSTWLKKQVCAIVLEPSGILVELKTIDFCRLRTLL